VWYLAILATGSPYLPWPHEVASGFWKLLFYGDDRGLTLLSHSRASLVRVFYGGSLAVIVGVPLGVLMGWSRVFDELFDPTVEMLRPIPPIAWIPIVTLVIGSGLSGQGLIVFIGAFFPVLLSTISGIRGVPRILVEAALTLGAGRRDILKKVVIPWSLPGMITGIRTGLGVGWMCIVAAEMMGLKEAVGLGFEILYMIELGHYWGAIDAMIMIGLIGFLMNGGIRWLERHLLVWREVARP